MIGNRKLRGPTPPGFRYMTLFLSTWRGSCDCPLTASLTAPQIRREMPSRLYRRFLFPVRQLIYPEERVDTFRVSL